MPQMSGDNMTSTGQDQGTAEPGMIMYFHTGTKEIVLFEQFRIVTVTGMVIACLMVILLTIFYEGLKQFRVYLIKKYSAPHKKSVSPSPSKYESLENETVIAKEDKPEKTTWSRLSSGHILQSFLQMLQLFIGYCLMLIFMTYNVWLCLSVLLGAGLGYFFFGTTHIVEAEHCA